MKRAMIITLALLLLAACFPAVGEQAEELLTSGDYEYRVLEDGTAEITSYNSLMVVFPDIPDRLNGLEVTRIGENAFRWNSILEGITLPHSVISIGDGAFYGCENLTSISIPNSVNDIGVNPFSYCVNLNRVVVHPDHPALATIDGVLFSKADKRLVWYPMAKEDTAYEIPQGILSIGNEAFSACENLSSITIPDSVTSIGDEAFSFCNNLSSINIPDSVINVGHNPFRYCISLKQVVVHPDHPNLVSIDGALFSKSDKRLIWYPITRKDTAYKIPQGTLSIGTGAFYGCENFSGITIPDSVISIGDEAFNRCSSLTSITIPDSVISIGAGAFYDCRSLKEIIIHDGVVSIGPYVFSFCDNLISITIPDSVVSIGDGAFYICSSLKKVIVAPDSYAQKYCEERGLPFAYQENTDWLNN